jgi:telomerase reverse transcriptase
MTARRIVQVMKSGFPEYGAHISPNKTLLSYTDHNMGSAQVLRSCSTSESDSTGPSPRLMAGFPFCGFLIDIETLDICMDHHRMLTGRMSPSLVHHLILISAIEQSFALRSNRKKGSSFLGWLSRQLENRNHVAYVSHPYPTSNKTDGSSIRYITIWKRSI